MTPNKRARLPLQVNTALVVAQAGRQINRIQRLWIGQEHSFALLVVWTRIEALLKLIRYHDRIDEGWPSDLSFVTTKWFRLKRIEQEDVAMYAQVLRGDKSLWKIRNQITHGGFRIAPEVGAPLGFAGEWIAAMLESIAPSRESLARQLQTHHNKTRRGAQ
jgi:hypothetical protein